MSSSSSFRVSPKHQTVGCIFFPGQLLNPITFLLLEGQSNAPSSRSSKDLGEDVCQCNEGHEGRGRRPKRLLKFSWLGHLRNWRWA